MKYKLSVLLAFLLIGTNNGYSQESDSLNKIKYKKDYMFISVSPIIGAWSAFGICGCKCENTSMSIAINPVSYEDFLNWADQNGIVTTNLRTELLAMISQNNINALRNGGQDITIADSLINNFAENCKNIIDNFSSEQKTLITTYTN